MDFDRNWVDYLNGFGDAHGNRWIGLENIHQLTTRQTTSLQIDFEMFDTGPFTLTYSRAVVGGADANYSMAVTGFTPTDRVLSNPFHSRQFTTKDRDHDLSANGNCAVTLHRGGWWYSGCGYMNLNGNYEGDLPEPTKTGILMCYIDTTSNSYRDTKTMKTVTMKLIHTSS